MKVEDDQRLEEESSLEAVEVEDVHETAPEDAEKDIHPEVESLEDD